MPRRTKQQSDATAGRVLAVATELFAEHGYARVGLERVAVVAGVTRGAVYHHFASKAELFHAVVRTVQLSVAEAVAEAADRAGTPWEGLEAGCRMFLTASSAPPARRILLVDAPAVLDWAAWRTADAAASGRLLEQALSELQAAGVVAGGPVPAMSALLSGAMNEAALRIAASADPDGAAEETWPVLRAMLSALRSDGRSPGAA